jgi:hypothetical protein
MEPSSKGALLALAAQLAWLALWPVDGAMAAPARRAFVQHTFVPHRGTPIGSNFRVANGPHRHVRPGDAGLGVPAYWSGPLPGAAAYPDYPDDAAPGFAPPPFYSPWMRWPAPCSKPLVIKVTKTTKPAPNLPRVVYGTPSVCGD